MKNEVGDKSPNEVALSVLIEGEALTLVPLRSICRGGYHPPERKKKKEELWATHSHPIIMRCATTPPQFKIQNSKFKI